MARKMELSFTEIGKNVWILGLEKSSRIWVWNVKCVKHISFIHLTSGDVHVEVRYTQTCREAVDARDVNVGVIS